MKRLEKFSVYSLVTILLMIVTYLTCTSMVTTAYMYDWEDTLFIDDNIFLNIGAVLLVIAASWFLCRRKTVISGRFVKIYIIAVNVLMVWFVLSTQFVSVDDQFQVLSTASAFLKGNYEPWNQGGYCFRWGHQNGIVLIYAFLSLIFGEGNYLVFQLLNILFVGITYYCIYKTFKKFVPSNNVTKLILMALYTFLPYLMYVTYIYGTLIGMMFASAGIYFVICFLDDTDVKCGLAAAVLLALATVCKSNYFIHIIAVCILLLVDALKNEKKDFKTQGIRKIILIGAVIGACVLSRTVTTAVIENKIGKEAPKGSPTILFVVMGMQEGWRAPGWCNSFDDLMYEQCGYDQDETNKTGWLWFKKETAEFCYNMDYAVEFFNQKLASIWVNPTFECFEIQKSRPSRTGVPDVLLSVMDVGSPVNTFLMELMDVLQTVLYFGVFLYCILCIRKIDFRELIFALIFAGAFLFYILWEARCHYTVPVIICLIPYSVMGYASCTCAAEKVFSGMKAAEGDKADWKKKVFNGTNIWLLVVVVFTTVVTACMIDYSIPQEKETYEQFLTHYAYGSRIADGTYQFRCYMDENMTLGLKNTEDGTELYIEPSAEKESQFFSIGYNFYENGLNHYYIWSSSGDRMLYLRDESMMGFGKVYTHNYSMGNKNLWTIVETGEDLYYIKNIYDMALAYNIYTNEVLLVPFNGEDNQKWKIEKIE